MFTTQQDNLKVHLVGKNVITTRTSVFLQNRKSNSVKDPELTIDGEGTLTVNNQGVTNFAALDIHPNGKLNVTCKELTLNTNRGIGIGSSFRFSPSGHSQLYVGNNAVLKVRGEGGSISNLNNMAGAPGYRFYLPQGARWNLSANAVCDDQGNVIKTDVIYAPDGWMGDVMPPTIPSENRPQISNITETGATVSWYPATDNVSTNTGLQYQLMWRPSTSATWNFSPKSTSKTYTLTGLVAGTKYITNVRVFDETGNYADYLDSEELSYGIFMTHQRYDLWIAGTQVSDDNCNNLSDIPGVTGTVIYDPETKTLMMEDATISTNSAVAVQSATDRMEIKVKGTVNITSQSSNAIYLERDGYITGDGTLNATSGTDVSIKLKHCWLRIYHTTVNTKGETGLAGVLGTEGLNIIESTFTAEGTRVPLGWLDEFELSNCDFFSPKGIYWNDNTGFLHGSDGLPVQGRVVIKPTTSLGLKVAGVEVNLINCDNLLPLDKVTSSSTQPVCRYDPETKTLTMQNLIFMDTDNGIECEMDGLTVQASKCTINCYGSGLSVTGSLTVAPGSSLDIVSQYSSGISVSQNSELFLDSCRISTKGWYGILGDKRGSALRIRNATVAAEGDSAFYGSILNFTDFILEASAITSPEGAEWMDEKMAVYDADSNAITSLVEITPVTYDVLIAGSWISPLNHENLSTLPGVESGTITYDLETKTLTLDNVTIHNKKGGCQFRQSGYC